MKEREKIKIIYEGEYIAKVKVKILEDETGWSPYLTPEEAIKLDKVREALKSGNIKEASKYGEIFKLHPVAV